MTFLELERETAETFKMTFFHTEGRKQNPHTNDMRVSVNNDRIFRYVN